MTDYEYLRDMSSFGNQLDSESSLIILDGYSHSSQHISGIGYKQKVRAVL